MFALNNGDKIRGDASVANKVDYLIHGTIGIVLTQLANGQLQEAIGDLYEAAAAVGIGSLTLVNTHTSAITVNLYLTPSGGTARRMIPKDLSLQPGYAAIFDGQKLAVYDVNGNLLTLIGNVTGLSGLLADDQHVLDSEVLAYLLSLPGAAANLKSFLNAAGNGLEWATGIKIGTFTRDTSAVDGNVDYTGIGFKPSHVIFLASIDSTLEVSIGFDNGVVRYALEYGVSNWRNIEGYSMLLYQTLAIYLLAYISSMNPDGFTITWAKTGAKTGTAKIFYIAFR